MTTITLAPPADPVGGAAFVPAAITVAGRTIRKFLRTPSLLIAGTAQMLMFLLSFRYVFGGAIHTGALPYVDFLIPGYITTGVLFSGMGAATGVAEDREAGLFDRLRSLPIPRSAAITGRALAECSMLLLSMVISTAAAFLVGFRLHAGAGAGLAAFALCLLFGFAFLWLFMLVGLVAGNAQAAQGLAFLVFPLTFVSSAYVPVKTLPGWMQAFADHQPLTVMVNAVRSLTQGHAAAGLLGHPSGHYLVPALVWSAVIVAVFGPLAVRRYERG